MRATVLISFLALFASAPAVAQQTVLQSGPITNGHAPMYVAPPGGTTPVVKDGGGSGGGPVGTNPGEVGITALSPTGTYPVVSGGNGPNGEHDCIFDAPTTNAGGYHYICLDANAQGGGLLSYGALGAASVLPFQILANGTLVNFSTGLAALHIGGTSVTGGASGQFLWDNAGVLGGVALNGLVVGNGASTPTAIVPGANVAAGLAANKDAANGFVGVGGSTTELNFTQQGTAPATLTLDARMKNEAIDFTDYSGADPTDTSYVDTAWTNFITQVKASGRCGHVPEGVYKFQNRAVVDLASVASTGICLYGDGAQKTIMDVQNVSTSPQFVIEASGGTSGSPVAAFYFNFLDIGIRGNSTGITFAVGQTNLADQLNSFNVRTVVNNLSTSGTSIACSMGAVYGPSNVQAVCNNAGHGYAMQWLQSQFVVYNLSLGNSDVGLHITGSGYSLSNSVFPEIEVVNTGDILIDGTAGGYNVFYSPYLQYANGAYAITSTAGAQSNNVFINPNFVPVGAASNLVQASQGQVFLNVAGGQTTGSVANVFQLTNSAGNAVFEIDASGNSYLNNNVTGGNQFYEITSTGTHEFYVGASDIFNINSSGVNVASGTLNIGGSQIAVGNLANLAGKTLVGNNGGSSAAPSALTVPQTQALLGDATLTYTLTGVNFNSANSDTSIAIALPTGYSRYLVARAQISGASGTLTTATAGLYTAAAGGGTAVATTQAVTVNTASDATNNNTQALTINNAASQSYTSATYGTLYFHIGTAEGSSATANVALQIVALP